MRPHGHEAPSMEPAGGLNRPARPVRMATAAVALLYAGVLGAACAAAVEAPTAVLASTGTLLVAGLVLLYVAIR